MIDQSIHHARPHAHQLTCNTTKRKLCSLKSCSTPCSAMVQNDLGLHPGSCAGPATLLPCAIIVAGLQPSPGVIPLLNNNPCIGMLLTVSAQTRRDLMV